jgi:U3 small nucleolar RNA-associated protein 22
VEDSTTTGLPATPAYNSSLLADTTYFIHLAQLHSSASDAPAFKDACILGRTWLRQRGFGSSISKGGFGHFEWAILMSLLLKGGGSKGHAILLKGYNNYQMFKATVQFLASRDLSVSPLVLEAQADGLKMEGPVVFDGETALNVLFKMTPWGYKLVRNLSEDSERVRKLTRR